MNYNKLKEGKFTGDTLSSQTLDRYIVSVTEHNSNLLVPKHAHEHSYISLLLYGFYNEQSSLSEQILTPGTSLFRLHDFEHKNEIGPTKTSCFHFEVSVGDLNSKQAKKLISR